jgi:septin family protein
MYIGSIVTLAATGRTTFVNTLCGQKVLHSKDDDDISNAHIEEGVKIKPTTVGTWITIFNHMKASWTRFTDPQ